MTFRMPAEIARIAYWNKKAVYGLLFKASAKTVMTYRHRSQKLGAKEGLTRFLHSWGFAMTHNHPHVNMIVPGGGLSPDGNRWVACKPRAAAVETVPALVP